MVSTKAVQNKRRGGFNGIPDRQRFKPGGGHKPLNPRNMGAMFNANQLGDNPGFLDFNDDVQIPPATTTQTNGNSATTKATPATGNLAASSSASTTSGSIKGPMRGNNRKGNLNQKRQLMRNGNNMRRIPPGMNNHWGPPVPPVPHMFPMGGGRRNGPLPPPPPHFRVPPMGPRGMRGGPMMPPPPPNGRFVGPPMGPGPMSLMQRPLPPMPPMRGPMMTPMGRMIPPPLRNRADGPPMMRRNPNGKLMPSRGGKVTKITPRNVIANGKGLKSVAKKLKPKVPAKPREEYPLDKPWVTEEIKVEHDKKVELADRLKGNKDDALFAQFKEQRDRFVKMYDAARLEFIGKHPEQDVDKILTESGKNDKTDIQKPNDAVSTDTPAATSTTTTTTVTTETTASESDAADTSVSSA